MEATGAPVALLEATEAMEAALELDMGAMDLIVEEVAEAVLDTGAEVEVEVEVAEEVVVVVVVEVMEEIEVPLTSLFLLLRTRF